MEPMGIYKITNLKNNKMYIGQSRRIFSRWKQHTQSLSNIEDIDSLSPLRRAFVKYGLTTQISKEGTFSGFKFEIIELCAEDYLDECEYKWITKLNPEYNILMQEPSGDKLWPKRDRLSNACYIQYHNANAMGYYPCESNVLEYSDDSYIISKKRDCLRCKGERVYLIMGLKTAKMKKKRFFLWGYTQVEEIEVLDDEDGKYYGLRGIDYFCETPLLLNDLDGFDSFFKNTMGSFAYGLQNAIKNPFCHNIINAKYIQFDEIDGSEKYLEYISDFERNMSITDDFHLSTRDDNGIPVISFFGVDEDNGLYSRHRTINMMINYPELVIDQLLTTKYKTISILLFDGVQDIIDDFNSINFILYYDDESVFELDFVKELAKQSNITFESIND